MIEGIPVREPQAPHVLQVGRSDGHAEIQLSRDHRRRRSRLRHASAKSASVAAAVATRVAIWRRLWGARRDGATPAVSSGNDVTQWGASGRCASVAVVTGRRRFRRRAAAVVVVGGGGGARDTSEAAVGEVHAFLAVRAGHEKMGDGFSW